MASILAGAWAWNSRSRLEVDLGGHEDSKVVRVAGEVSAEEIEMDRFELYFGSRTVGSSGVGAEENGRNLQ